VDGVHDVLVGLGLVGLVVLCILEQDLVHVCGSVLEQLVMGVEDDDGDLAVAKYGQFVSLFHQPKLPLCECNLSISFIRDPGDLYLFSPHPCFFCRHCADLYRTFQGNHNFKYIPTRSIALY